MALGLVFGDVCRMMDLPAETHEVVGVRPYARLLTMLGEQLIKNDRIALVEIIKNSYDADASKVVVDFVQFSPKFSKTPSSVISIIDNGEGMSESTIKDHWLNPATAGKVERKLRSPLTGLGRVMQGEKGIGRFAIFKLGSKAKIVTRSVGDSHEWVIEYDLAFLDSGMKADSGRSALEEVTDSGVRTSPPVFLDEIEVQLTRRAPRVFDGLAAGGMGAKHGTRIEVSSLRSEWSEPAVRKSFIEVARLQPLVPSPRGDGTPIVGSEFNVDFRRDGIELPYGLQLDQSLTRLFKERTVLKVDGMFDSEGKSFDLSINGRAQTLSLKDPDVTALRAYKKTFGDKNAPRSIDSIACGPFLFSFYVFDVDSAAPIEFHLDPDEKEQVKEHRIYLYRDGVRVLPYGDPEDDWLQLDIIRGTQGASRVLSNDQTVGFVYISQQDNPNLQDKTNREGLLEDGTALADFVALIQIIISYLRRGEFARYLEVQKRQREAVEQSKEIVTSRFDAIRGDPTVSESVSKKVSELERAYKAEKGFLEMRANRTEDLAGVGLSVEAASHDILASTTHALRLARSIDDYVTAVLPHDYALGADARALVESMSFVASRLQDIQGLFVSTRQVKKPTNVIEYVRRVQRIYSSLMKNRNVSFELDVGPSELVVSTTDAALLQVLINFFDNALFWLDAASTNSPKILIRIDAERRVLTFADNGPGVKDADEPFIFEPFYSAKGDEGKGLGLYIARQVGIRSGFRVDLISDQSHQLLSGANFVIDFSRAQLNAN